MLKVFIGLAAVVFLLHQFYSSVYKPITTESAEYYEAVDGLNVTGVIIRQENIILSDTQGVLHYVTNDGSRVSKGGTVASVYDNADASITVNRISELEAQIKDIEELQGYNDLQASDLELVNQKINNALSRLITGNSAGNFSGSAAASAELLSAINRRQMITGEHTDFSQKLSALNSELSSLKAALPAAKGTIRSEHSGYFVSAVDGFEGLLSGSELDRITPEFLKNMKASEVPQNVIGKVVSDYEWYIAAKVTLNESVRYKEGDSLIIKTAVRSNPELPVKVKQINISSSSDSAVVIFSCQQMSSELASMRSGAMTVVSEIYEGLKVSKRALRVVDGQTGVYVVSGMTLNFVPVTVVYNTDDYIICEQQQSNDEVLRLYDEVVVKGKKLYDGKIID